MDDTGRIRRPLTPTARRIVFGSPPGEAREAELHLMSQVDRAHLVMLVEQGLAPREAGRALLGEIGKLRALDFAPLREREARRGLFLLYEDWLVSRLGERTAGYLRTGRSRNDLNATVLLLRLRTPYQRLMDQLLRLQAVLLRGARRHGAVVMPAYTHYQAAFPVTLGHYLAGMAIALDRDLDSLAHLDSALARCPLGAGAGGGTAVPIDPGRTAALLGFEWPVGHSIDAVASRDLVLRLLAGASVLGVTLSRLAADLLLWTTGEFGFLLLPDELVGSSSLMPQKRNPFLLEHAKGRAALPLGAFVAAATSMHATPFGNSVAVGTEGCSQVTEALGAAADAATLLRLVVSGARPVPSAMLARAREGHTTATALADRVAADQGLSFREAHHLVGSVLGGAPPPGTHAAGISVDDFDPVAVAARARYGAGPGAGARLDAPTRRRRAWAVQRAARALRWSRAAAALDLAVARVEWGGTADRGSEAELLSQP